MKVKKSEKEISKVDGRLRLEMKNGSDWVSGLGFDNGPYWASSVKGKRPLARVSYWSPVVHVHVIFFNVEP